MTLECPTPPTKAHTKESSFYLVAGADLQFGVQRHENRRRGHSNEQEGDGHGHVLRSVFVDFGWNAQNSDPGNETATNHSHE